MKTDILVKSKSKKDLDLASDILRGIQNVGSSEEKLVLLLYGFTKKCQDVLRGSSLCDQNSKRDNPILL